MIFSPEAASVLAVGFQSMGQLLLRAIVAGSPLSDTACTACTSALDRQAIGWWACQLLKCGPR